MRNDIGLKNAKLNQSRQYLKEYTYLIHFKITLKRQTNNKLKPKWESLKKRRKDNRLILLYKGLKGKASVPTDDLIPKTRRCRNQHFVAFQTPIANTDVYKGSFFPQTIRDWNALLDSLISSAEDAEDCVAKFTSLVRARG